LGADWLQQPKYIKRKKRTNGYIDRSQIKNNQSRKKEEAKIHTPQTLSSEPAYGCETK
jgi:hypothetical protein